MGRGRPAGNWSHASETDMAELIHQHSSPVHGEDGTEYRALIFGAARQDGTWNGWIEFVPSDSSRARLRTDQETSQPDRKAVEYWAGGLEPVYLEGALGRAVRQRAKGGAWRVEAGGQRVESRE